MSRGVASGARRLLAAIGVGTVLAAALPSAFAKPRDHDADCACGDCVCGDCVGDDGGGMLGEGGLFGDYRASHEGACDGECFCGLLVTAAGGCASGLETGWVRADYILWQRDGVYLPTLVTAALPTDPSPTFSSDTTIVLAGIETVSDGVRSGWAIEAGLVLNAYTGWAVAADYFNGGRDSYGFQAGPDDELVIARPFLNAFDGMEDVQVANVPGEVVGGVLVSAFDDFQGAGAWMETCVWSRGNACTSAGGARLSLLGGYRYYHHDSLVYIQEGLRALPGNTLGFEDNIEIFAEDKFAGRNEFHGAELGFEGRLQRCRWWCEGLAAFAFGGSRRVVFVEGATFTLDANDQASAFLGDLLTAGATNIGQYTDDECEVIPRFRFEMGWQWTERIGFHAGYNLIVWDGVVQAADHLPPDLATDPRNLPLSAVVGGGGADPVFPGIRDTTLVAHGLDFGLEVNF